MIIQTSSKFDRNIKKLQKRFTNIDYDFQILIDELLKNPRMGTPIGKGFYKVRLQNSDINKGKSGGYRVITYFIDEDNVLNLLTIYYKGDKESISEEEILKIAKNSNLI